MPYQPNGDNQWNLHKIIILQDIHNIQYSSQHAFPVIYFFIQTKWMKFEKWDSQGNLSLYLFLFIMLDFFAKLMSAVHGTGDSSCKSCIRVYTYIYGNIMKSTKLSYLVTIIHITNSSQMGTLKHYTLNCCSKPEHFACGSSVCKSVMTDLNSWATTAVSPQHR